jgi:hypothetical protein
MKTTIGILALSALTAFGDGRSRQIEQIQEENRLYDMERRITRKIEDAQNPLPQIEIPSQRSISINRDIQRLEIQMGRGGILSENQVQQLKIMYSMGLNGDRDYSKFMKRIEALYDLDQTRKGR